VVSWINSSVALYGPFSKKIVRCLSLDQEITDTLRSHCVFLLMVVDNLWLDTYCPLPKVP